jgi:hypothetical protein
MDYIDVEFVIQARDPRFQCQCSWVGMWNIWGNWTCPRSANWIVCLDRPRLCDEGREFLSFLSPFPFRPWVFAHEFIAWMDLAHTTKFHRASSIRTVQSSISRVRDMKVLFLCTFLLLLPLLPWCASNDFQGCLFFARLLGDFFGIIRIRNPLIQVTFAASQSKSVWKSPKQCFCKQQRP